jgi:nucleotide-binding universal stress UspA family protein
MRWLVGIDLGGRSGGALQMARWLVRTAKMPVQLVIAHVIDERMWGPSDVAAALRPSAERALAQELAAVDLSAATVTTHVVTARTVVDGLAELAAAHACDGMILGRIAQSRGRGLVRLGSVARRSLRRLPRPVMIVPPDFSADTIGAGALVLGTDLADDSRSAGRLALRLADDLARALVIVHVDPSYVFIPDYVGGGGIVLPRAPRHVRADVEAWARACDLETSTVRLADGPIVEHLIVEGERESAPMLVVGSRELALDERIFSSSVGSDLARLADRPVLVVPTRA